MDSDQGKLFIGGISWETSEETLNEHFGKYGEVLQSVIMRDKLTARPRGFGFVVFADPSVLDVVVQDKHNIDGRTVEAKRALSREEQHTTARPGNPTAGRNFAGGGGGGGGGGGNNMRTKKIFVGGLPPTLSEEGFRQYFENYGQVTDVVVMYDQSTQRPRGFGFISFDTEEAVDRVLHQSFHDLNGKMVEVKRALPKDANPNSGARSMGGGGYQGYGASGGNTGSYDGRAESNRYMQPQAAGGNFPGYGTSGYGYGAASNGVGYGGYGVAGYGNTGGGYGGPAAGAYGNPNAASTGYAGVPSGASRNPWGAQAAGYNSAAYNANSGYGTQAPWSAAGSGGAQSAQTGQSPSGAAGYGNQGYGGYGGSDGSYANPGSYGAVGGRAGNTPNSNSAGVGGGDQQGSGAGYGGGGYNDANLGYQTTGYGQGGSYGAGQTNGVPGSQVGYGGYGRQTQQQ